MLRHTTPLLSVRCRPAAAWLARTCSAPQLRRSSSAAYDATLNHLRIGRHTRVLFQGFTGRHATVNARESLAWGTNIVGGVTPGREGEHLGLPVLPSVRAAVEKLRPDATGIYVPAALAPAAIEEAIEAEVPLVVAVAEHIPLHAMLRIAAMLKTQKASRLVGANSPGILSAVGHCRIGFQPLLCFQPDDNVQFRVGIAARSGTLSYEAVASTTRVGLGQSLCIGVGGDIVAGTDLRDALAVLATDPDTHAIALIGEIGGTSEIDAAEWIRAYHAREANPKPIVALLAGIHAVPGRMMGHSGAFALPGEPDVHEKIQALQEAGVTIIDHPEKFGPAIQARLEGREVREDGGGQHAASKSGLFGQASTTQRRSLHVAAGPRPWRSARRPTTPAAGIPSQTRSLYLSQDDSFNVLREHDINAGEESSHGPRRYLAITVDRSSRSPCVLAAPDAEEHSGLKRFPFSYHPHGIDGFLVDRVAAHLQVAQHPHIADALRHLLREMYSVFVKRDAFLVETTIMERLADVKVVGARLGLGDAVVEDAEEAKARKHGIVYVKLDDSEATIGTLVNGAGLAMNTVDALAEYGGRTTNFLDTGGKATSETVHTCFEMLLRDPRVRVIFVNAFGGLTLGDMIARGVLLAFQNSHVTVPVVVRIRGTNEEEGQRIIRESGLPLYAFEEFEEAAAKAVELAKQT